MKSICFHEYFINGVHAYLICTMLLCGFVSTNLCILAHNVCTLVVNFA